jgi:hypothetical protein
MSLHTRGEAVLTTNAINDCIVKGKLARGCRISVSQLEETKQLAHTSTSATASP